MPKAEYLRQNKNKIFAKRIKAIEVPTYKSPLEIEKIFTKFRKASIEE